ncbi:MAG TPA: DNA gyrase modulator, partial [Tissierellaceae bacterium]|nr:DNA gyrase modulator [Tissierellaceae bacterium]
MLNRKIVENVLEEALSRGGDFAEIFLEDKMTSNIKLVQGEIKDSLSGRDFGVGIRILDGTNSVYGFTNGSSEKELVNLAKSLALSMDGGSKAHSRMLGEAIIHDNSPVKTQLS